MLQIAINEKAEAQRLTPEVAWPTLAFGAVVVAAHATLVGLALAGVGPLWAYTIPLGLNAYAGYTLVHESVHRNIVPRTSRFYRVHDVFGWIGSLLLFMTWPLLERTHKGHHSHANTDRDPDISVKGTFWNVTARFGFTAALIHIPMDLIRLVFKPTGPHVGYIAAQDEMTAGERRVHRIANWVMCMFFWSAILFGYAPEAILLYWFPAVIGAYLLTILFQWLPHRPFDQTARYLNTRNTGRNWLNLPMLYQNWHLMHHLWPSVPFYNYPKLYHALRPILIEKGARHNDGER